MTTLLPVIMAGGSGTRLWPLSREAYPKQFLSLQGEASLLQQTLQRLDGLSSTKPLVICNEAHRFLAAGQLQEMGVAADILLEPVGRNTAPTLALAACYAMQQAGNEPPVLLVMPADHVMPDAALFQSTIEQLLPQVQAGKLGTLGIQPTAPETGYGYIQAAGAENDVQPVNAFVEKPDETRAKQYLEAGGYYWNSGIFLLRADQCLQWLKQYAPDILAACQEAIATTEADRDFTRIDEAAFTQCPSNSIDYALAEPLSREADNPVVVAPYSGQWSDVGTWSALWDIQKKDAQGNVCRSHCYLEDSTDNLVWPEERLIGVLGVDNLVIVDTDDALLVAHKSKAQHIKQLVQRLKDNAQTEYQQHRKVYRPWGKYDSIDEGERYKVKHISVAPGASLSLQKHHHRAEHWVVVTGTAKVTRGEETFLLSENQSTYIPIGETHRLENPGKIPLEMIEVQSGAYLGEDDIVRLQDDYGRNK